jgi:hypothetical protein
MPAVHTIDDEERKPAQQKASGVAGVRWRGFRSLSDQVHGSVEFASKARGCGLVALAVPPLCGLGFVGGQRVDFDRRTEASARGESAANFGPGNGLHRSAIELGHAAVYLGRPRGLGVLVHFFGVEALE